MFWCGAVFETRMTSGGIGWGDRLMYISFLSHLCLANAVGTETVQFSREPQVLENSCSFSASFVVYHWICMRMILGLVEDFVLFIMFTVGLSCSVCHV